MTVRGARLRRRPSSLARGPLSACAAGLLFFAGCPPAPSRAQGSDDYYSNFDSAESPTPKPAPTPTNPTGERPRLRPQIKPDDLKVDRIPPLQQPASAPWTLSRLIDRSLEANVDLLLARANVERQIGQRLQLRARLLPRIGVNGSGSYRTEGLIDRPPGELAVPPSDRTSIAQSSYDLSVEVRYLLFDGLSNVADARAGKLGQERALWQLEDAAYRTVALTRQAYYSLLLRRSLNGVREEALALVRRQLDISQKRFKAGEITEFDTLRVQTEIAAAESDVAEAADTQSAGEQLLRRTIQLPDRGAANEPPLKVEGKLEPLPFNLPFEQAVARAMNKRNDLVAARLQVEAADQGVRSAFGRFLPTLDFFASDGLRSSFYSADRTLRGVTVGITGQWAVFDGGANSGRVRSAQADRNTAKLQLAQLEQNLISNLRDLYASIDHSRTLIRTQGAAAGYARRSLDQAQRLYQLGGVTLEEVLNTRLALTRSQVALQQAIFNFNISVVQAEYTASLQAPLKSSIPLPSPETESSPSSTP